MSLTQRLKEYVSACFTGIWIESQEPDEAIVEIAKLCRDEGWRLATWDVARGLKVAGHNDDSSQDAGGSDPLAAIRAVSTLASPDSSALLVLTNFHRFLSSAEVVQALSHQITTGKQNRSFVVILAPIVQLPTELEKQFVVIDHPLPTREQLADIAQGVATESGELPDDAGFSDVLDAAAGLTRYEAEGAFSLSLVRHGKVVPQAIWSLKSQMLKKSGLLALHEGNEKFADLGGLESLKSFCTRALRRRSNTASQTQPRGVLLLSPPGCGKSALCKALGNEIGRPTLVLDVGSLLGSLVGESEKNVRQALRIADAMAPCILFVDECEKALSGVNGSGDSGVSTRLFGTLLTYLQDHTTEVFVVATSNNISKLPPEFARSGRFDGVFFVDLPDRKTKDGIWNMYTAKFGLDANQKRPVDTDWTGAEIRSCCRLAALLEVSLIEASQNVVPVAVTASEIVEKLRTWASGRCLSADNPGVYRYGTSPTEKVARKVRRDPSNN
jgi:hypothetical protein